MMYRYVKIFVILICILAGAFAVYETFIKEKPVEQQYVEIIDNIKDNPQQAIKDIRKLADKLNSAAMEYLILVSIYEPQKVNTPEFEKIAQKLHQAITSQYDKIVGEQPFYRSYQDDYNEKVGQDYILCYKNLSCLIEIGAYHFSKFFNIWDYKSGYALYVPWKISVPCPVAQKLHLTAILDGAYGGHGAEAIDISNCNQYSQYDFSKEVEDYIRYIYQELNYETSGTIRFYYAAKEIYENILSHYDPELNLAELSIPKKYLHTLPLEGWAMESYPNYKYFSEVINYGIGFNNAADKLAQHYIKTFNVSEEKAKEYAGFALLPKMSLNSPINKNTLRYKILTNQPVEELKSWIINKKLQGETFEEPETPHQKDEILMVSIHRPDVLKMLIETCPMNEEKLSCLGLNTDVDAKNSFGKTALMYAAQYGFMNSVKILLEAGADINAQTQEGNMTDKYCYDDLCIANGKRTALMYAIQEGHLDIAKYLVSQGADINLKDSQGKTIYDYLSGKAPDFGNFKTPPMGEKSIYEAPLSPENKNVSPQQAKEFIEFLKSYDKA